VVGGGWEGGGVDGGDGAARGGGGLYGSQGPCTVSRWEGLREVVARKD
jgi:hypothetical protein